MDPELERILANVQMLVAEGAPEADMKEYLDIEGYTFASLNRAVGEARKEEAALQRVAQQGGNAATDFVQVAAGPVFDAVRGTLGGAFSGKAPGAMSMLDVGGGVAIPQQGADDAMRAAGQAAREQSRQHREDLRTLAPGASAAAESMQAVPLIAAGGLGPAVSAVRGLKGAASAALRSPFLRRIVGYGGLAELIRWRMSGD